MHTKSKRNRLIALLLLFLLALAMRAWRAQQEVIASPDIIRFVAQMHSLQQDPIATMRAEVFHPLHAALANLVHAAVGGLFNNDRMSDIWSLRIVGILAGATLSTQIARLARWFGAPFWASWIAGALWIVGRRQSMIGADGLSDALTWTLVAESLLVAMPALRALHRQQRLGVGRFLLAGILSGLAYLARPEGSAAALILLATIGGLAFLPRHRRRPTQRPLHNRYFKLLPRRPIPLLPAARSTACILTGFLLLSLPYMLIIHSFTGKKPLFPPPPTPAPAAIATNPPASEISNRVLPSPEIENRKSKIENSSPLLKIFQELQETFSWSPCLVLLLALPLKPRLWGRPRLRLLALIWTILWLAVMFWLLRTAGYLDGRHTLPLILLLHILLALALVAWTRPMACFIARYRRNPTQWNALPHWRKSPRWPKLSTLPLIALALIPGVLLLREPPRADRANLLVAAHWIQANVRHDAVICDRERLVGYYSLNPYANWTGLSTEPTDRLDEIQTIRQSHNNAPALLGLSDQNNYEAIGPFHPIAHFTSANHTYTLYAAGEDWHK